MMNLHANGERERQNPEQIDRLHRCWSGVSSAQVPPPREHIQPELLESPSADWVSDTAVRLLGGFVDLSTWTCS